MPNSFLEEELDDIDFGFEENDQEDPEGQTDTEAPEKKPFRIENMDQLVWAMRKLRAIQVKNDDINRTAANEAALVDVWKKRELKKNQAAADYFAMLLELYHRECFAKDKKLKTITTPYGETKLHKQGPKLITQEDELIKWMQANHPEWVKINPAIIVKDFKKGVVIKESQVIDTVSGEVIPWVHAVDREDAFTVKINVF